MKKIFSTTVSIQRLANQVCLLVWKGKNVTTKNTFAYGTSCRWNVVDTPVKGLPKLVWNCGVIILIGELESCWKKLTTSGWEYIEATEKFWLRVELHQLRRRPVHLIMIESNYYFNGTCSYHRAQVAMAARQMAFFEPVNTDFITYRSNQCVTLPN